MDTLKPKVDFYEFYVRSQKELYAHGWIEQIYPYPVFRKIQIDKKSNEISIEGIITIDGSIKDTTDNGFCCFGVLVAQLNKKEQLYNIRRYGRTLLKTDSLNASGRDGFFSLSFKGNKNDVLIIGNPGRAGGGAVAYYVGKLIE